MRFLGLLLFSLCLTCPASGGNFLAAYDGTGGQMVYCGDNNVQSAPSARRAAKRDFVELNVVSEPKTTGLLFVEVFGIALGTGNPQNWLG